MHDLFIKNICNLEYASFCVRIRFVLETANISFCGLYLVSIFHSALFSKSIPCSLANKFINASNILSFTESRFRIVSGRQFASNCIFNTIGATNSFNFQVSSGNCPSDAGSEHSIRKSSNSLVVFTMYPLLFLSSTTMVGSSFVVEIIESLS